MRIVTEFWQCLDVQNKGICNVAEEPINSLAVGQILLRNFFCEEFLVLALNFIRHRLFH